MRQYLDLLQFVMQHGQHRGDRTGVGTISCFSPPAMRFDLRQGFPLVTTKKVNFKAVVDELLWFLSGSTNLRDLKSPQLWSPWADENGDLGPIYGANWRAWNGQHDQISELLERLKTNPLSRRHVISAWNVSAIPDMALPPCHVLAQFYVDILSQELDCQMYQRSADLAIGVPFNVASYALLTSMIAQECGLTPRYFIHTFGDAHIYADHEQGVREQLTRAPHALPTLRLANKPLLDMRQEDIALDGYTHDPAIRFSVAV